MEICSGCGEAAESLPVIGITRDRETGRMAPFPVCAACWIDPAHRTAPLDMHFFERPDYEARQAAAHEASLVQAAEDNILSDPPPDA